MTHIAPFGSWKSPITSARIVESVIGIFEVRLDGDSLYWIEARPEEQGRYALVRRSPGGEPVDLLPPPWNARTRVHEYGGGSYLPLAGVVYFTNYADQRLYRLNPGGQPEPLTPPVDLRYADFIFDQKRNRLIGVREDHTHPGEITNTLVSLRLDGSELERGGQVLVSGCDFYAGPRLSPDGSQLAWQAWNHPDMPWDGAELWLGQVGAGGEIRNPRRLAGGEGESIYQPEWSPDGMLYFVSDRSGWWNLYRWQDEQAQALHAMQAEFGEPQWVFGRPKFAFESPERMVCAYRQNGRIYLAQLDTRSLEFTPLDTPYTNLAYITAAPGRVFFTGGSPTIPQVLAELDLESGELGVLKASETRLFDARYLSIPEPIEFTTTGGQTAYANYYPPTNGDFDAPAGEKPPLIVESHGGPTGSTFTSLDLETQFWTSRGFAVVDVDYGGSTGYGRAYRRRLEGQWGIVDVEDCIAAAKYLVARGLADPARLAIHGGSAGGYTTLCALTFHNVFRAGASYYGVSDLETLAQLTHKFESCYMERLVGPYPEQRDLYVARSPIHFVGRLNCPLILFQGEEDQVVPPEQSRRMYEAVLKKGLPVVYLEFPGEQHGFRQAEHIQQALDAELYFYGKVFGFEPAGLIQAIDIKNT